MNDLYPEGQVITDSPHLDPPHPDPDSDYGGQDGLGSDFELKQEPTHPEKQRGKGGSFSRYSCQKFLLLGYCIDAESFWIVLYMSCIVFADVRLTGKCLCASKGDPGQDG